MNIKTQRLIAILFLTVAVILGGGLYLLQSSRQECAAMDSSNQILLKENKELKKQLKEIPLLIQQGDSKESSTEENNSSPADLTSLSEAEKVTNDFLMAYYISSSKSSPMKDWEAYSAYMTEELAKKYKPKEDTSTKTKKGSKSTCTSSCQIQRIYSKKDGTGIETFTVLLTHTKVKTKKEEQNSDLVIIVKSHLSLIQNDWKIDQIVTVNTDIGPYVLA